MATTKKVRAIQARRQALMEHHLNELLESDDPKALIAQWKRENAKLIHQIECMREAIKRFTKDYPECVQ